MDGNGSTVGAPTGGVVSQGFGWALIQLRSGKKLTRHGWNGQGQFLQLQVPDENSKMRRPYIYISPVDGELVPWVASHTDMLSEDWLVLEEQTA